MYVSSLIQKNRKLFISNKYKIIFLNEIFMYNTLQFKNIIIEVKLRVDSQSDFKSISNGNIFCECYRKKIIFQIENMI